MALAGPPRSHENGAAAKAIFTPVPRREILRTSPFGCSANFGFTQFSEVRRTSERCALRRKDPSPILAPPCSGRLSDDLAVLDQAGVGPISYPDVVVLVGPLQESLAKVSSSRCPPLGSKPAYTCIYMRRKGIQPFACSAEHGACGAQSGSGAITGPLIAELP
jgi:hypothetical protein